MGVYRNFSQISNTGLTALNRRNQAFPGCLSSELRLLHVQISVAVLQGLRHLEHFRNSVSVSCWKATQETTAFSGASFGTEIMKTV